MQLNKAKAKDNLKRLIAKFERELSSGQVYEYNEEATKTAFIQPLLKDVLGWDVTERDEVSPEYTISKGRIDYGLKIEGKIKIFVEAKPVKADLNKHIEQAIRYGYSHKGVPFVLLTDFEGIKLFDVTVKPDIRNPKKGVKLDLNWKDYLGKFDSLWVLSKESVINGKLDELLRVKPRDRVQVDKAILSDLENWRESLAKDIYKHNHKLFSGDLEKDAVYLREITQKLLDRIIFMRFCEDRHLTYRSQLRDLFEGRGANVGTNTMVFLGEEFRQYERTFNSNLFLQKQWERELAIDFEVMKDIILESYNPYDFAVLPIEVLGNIYEQYLGYTIRLTEQQVKYEQKPDVRKAGGVYYTPEYIVDYIVKNTVGKMLKELTPNKIKKIRILDPACGSGSFLIKAYEEMLRYYKEQKKKGHTID
ncbi:MAG: N-6 DNA methylase, partial [bacterium]|nr:N-6 DNA methylase [bacterium]